MPLSFLNIVYLTRVDLRKKCSVKLVCFNKKTQFVVFLCLYKTKFFCNDSSYPIKSSGKYGKKSLKRKNICTISANIFAISCIYCPDI